MESEKNSIFNKNKIDTGDYAKTLVDIFYFWIFKIIEERNKIEIEHKLKTQDAGSNSNGLG